MPNVTVAEPGKVPGGTDSLEMYLKVFAGETITAFERVSVTNGRHILRTISSGK